MRQIDPWENSVERHSPARIGRSAGESTHLHETPGAEILSPLGVNRRGFQLRFQLLAHLAHKIAVPGGNAEPYGSLGQAESNLAAPPPGAVDLREDGIADLRD